MMKLETCSAAALARLFAAGALDPVDATEFFLERIAERKANPAFILVTAHRARAEAAASRARYREGRPLSAIDGVPVAWKDIVDFAGVRTTAGSALFADSPPKGRDAPILASLAAAGTVALGKTNLSEFAFTGIGLNPHFGNPTNPHDTATRRIVGGSSSGSAVAVAAGLAPCAIGSDTGGSIRGPAAFCGIVGFKPTERRIDTRGVFPLSRTLDTIGPMAHTVEDCVLLDMALRGAIVTPVRRASVEGLALVVPDRNGIADADHAVAANMENALSRLSAAGVKITRRSIPLLDEMHALTARHGPLIAIEAYAEHGDIFNSERGKRIDPRVLARGLLGRNVDSRSLIALQRGRERLVSALAAELNDSLLALPGTPMTAPPMDPLEAADELFRVTNLRAIHYSVIGNFFRMCGLSLPSGVDALGLPTGIQLLAPGGDDERLMSYGLEIERVLADWDAQ